jgi:plastocyanin
MTRKLTILLAALALAAFGLTACGGDDDETTSDSAAATETTEAPADETAEAPSGGSGGSLAISADAGGALAFDTTEATADAGTVEITFDNPSTTPHDLKIEGPDGDLGGTEVITESSAEASVELEPGDYTFYCSVDSHRDAGMEGTLTVE